MSKRSVEKIKKNESISETLRLKWFPWFQNKQTGEFLFEAPNDVNTLHFAPKTDKETIPYFLPNDDREINRQDFQHFIMKYAMQRSYMAPISNPQSVLDVGCGTERWAHEIAIQFPQATVFGVDIDSSLTRASTSKPFNYSFLKGDILKELPFPGETFDFVHQRFLHMAVPSSAWKHVIQELLRNTKKGGWIELAESDLHVQRYGPATRLLNEWGYTLARLHDINPATSTSIDHLLRLAHLQKIQSFRIDLPIGNWAGRLGTMVASDLLAFNVSIKDSILKHFNVSLAEYTSLSKAMREEWESNRSYFSVYVAYGQKQ